MKAILVVDDHPAICFAVKAVLEKTEHCRVQTVVDGISAMSMIKTESFDIVILDIALTKMDGLELLTRIHHYDKNCKVIILTSQHQAIYAKRAFKAGAVGFLSKDDDIGHLNAICELVLSGYSCFPAFCFDDMKHNILVTEEDLMSKLSDREMTVLRYLASGMSNKEIADRLLLSNKTISTYKTRLMEKLQLSTAQELQQCLDSYAEKGN